MGIAAAPYRRRLRLLALATTLIACAGAPAGSAKGNSADVNPPTPPSNITVSGVNASQLGFLWTKSTDDVGVAGYSLYLDGASAGTTTLNFTAFFTLTCSRTYTVTVIAFDAAGNRST